MFWYLLYLGHLSGVIMFMDTLFISFPTWWIALYLFSFIILFIYLFSSFLFSSLFFSLWVTTLKTNYMCIGMQDSSGTIWVDNFNITVYRVPPPPLPSPPINPPPPFTGHPPGVPRFRGTMSPQHYYVCFILFYF